MEAGDKVRYQRKRTERQARWTIISIDEQAATCTMRGDWGVKHDVPLSSIELWPEPEPRKGPSS